MDGTRGPASHEESAISDPDRPSPEARPDAGPAPSAAEHLAEHEARVRATEAVERVARKTAHALNNYLMVFAGGLDIIGSALDKDPERVRKMLAHMQEAADEAGGLADRLQAMRGPDGSSPEVLDLREVVNGAVQGIRKILGPKVELAVDTDDEPVLVCVDPERFEQVLHALAKNAAAAMPEAGTLRLRVRKGHVSKEEARADLPAGTYVMVDVEDTGVGMSPEVRAHLFHPFFTTTEDPDRGWGLTRVWGIIRQSKGTLWVDSIEGEGTTVTIHLPSVAIEPARTVEPAAEEPQQTTNGHTVLLVDDESPVRALVTDVLAEAGYEVLPAANGDEALEIARHHAGGIHLLLADLIMPGLNGREVAEHFAGLRPGSKVLFMSGFPADVLKRVSGDVPVPFLSKPFSPAVLRAKVREVLGEP